MLTLTFCLLSEAVDCNGFKAQMFPVEDSRQSQVPKSTQVPQAVQEEDCDAVHSLTKYIAISSFVVTLSILQK